MGNVFNSIIDYFRSEKRTKFLLLGLDNVGKTTLVYKLKLGEYLRTVSTLGFKVEIVEDKKFSMIIWDIEAAKYYRELSKQHYKNTDALIFMVNSCDLERIELVCEELHSLKSSDELQNVPVLVFANKQDIAIMSVSEITKKLELNKFLSAWHVQGCSMKTGEGLDEGFDWLKNSVEKINSFK